MLCEVPGNQRDSRCCAQSGALQDLHSSALRLSLHSLHKARSSPSTSGPTLLLPHFPVPSVTSPSDNHNLAHYSSELFETKAVNSHLLFLVIPVSERHAQKGDVSVCWGSNSQACRLCPSDGTHLISTLGLRAAMRNCFTALPAHQDSTAGQQDNGHQSHSAFAAGSCGTRVPHRPPTAASRGSIIQKQSRAKGKRRGHGE